MSVSDLFNRWNKSPSSEDTSVTYQIAVIDSDNKVLIPKGKLDFNAGFFPNNGLMTDLIPFKEKEKYGFANLKGEIVIPATFDYVQPFSEDGFQMVTGRVEVDAVPYAGPALPDYTPPTSKNLFMNVLLDEYKYNPNGTERKIFK